MPFPDVLKEHADCKVGPFSIIIVIMSSIGEEHINFVKSFIGSRLISEYHIPSSGDSKQINLHISMHLETCFKTTRMMQTSVLNNWP